MKPLFHIIINIYTMPDFRFNNNKELFFEKIQKHFGHELD